MRILPIQEVYTRRFARQREIVDLQYHAAGHCVHIGKLSPGCRACFVPLPLTHNFRLGSECNLDCVYCHRVGRNSNEDPDQILTEIVSQASVCRDPLDSSPCFSFSGGGEPLMYLDTLEKLVDRIRSLVDQGLIGLPWMYIYTNGLLADDATIRRLKEMGINELRFHIGASGFSRSVYANMEMAAKHIPVLSVETPSWPPHREKLFEMLPIIEDVGIKHLNLGEVILTRGNYRRIASILPDAAVYHCYELHLYDDGLVYDLIEEGLERGYSYSILDCNSHVKSIQRSPGKWVAYEDVDGMCADYEVA